MGATGLLTILAILIAGYGLLSDEKRLDIKLRITWFDLVILGIPFLAILFVIYSPIILSLFSFEAVNWRWGFTEDTMVFSCLLFIIIFLGWKLIGSRLPEASYARWAKDSEQYLRSKKFEQLGYLLNKYHEQLFEVVNNRAWFVGMHYYLMPKTSLQILNLGEKKPFYKPHLNALRGMLAKPFPRRCKKQDEVKQSISRLLKSPPFVDYLTEAYPMVAAKATCLDLGNEEYVTYFFKALMHNPESLLFRELRDNQNCSYTGEYYLDDSNQLLNFYFKDICVAKNVGVWQPVGDYVTGYIKKQRGQDNFYNQPNHLFSDGEERWACPIFIGSLFFEVMVSIAIFQRVKDHMWLMYVDDFLKEILGNLEHAEDVDGNREFPSKFDYLMYQVFSACDDWVGTVEYLDYKGVTAEERQTFPEYWAAKTLGSMLRKIIKTNKLPDSQKVYFLEIVVRRMQKLDQKGFNYYSKVIFDNSIREYQYSESDVAIVDELARLYVRIDHVLKHDQSTFNAEIEKQNVVN